MKIKTFIVDAFTDCAFSGNPTGICLPDFPLSESLMQSIAAELNYSETAFLHPAADDIYTVRYFTPTTEIAFCGHATAASAKLLFARYEKEKLTFKTIGNLHLEASRFGDRVRMKFPLYQTVQLVANAELLQAFKISDSIDVRFSKDLNAVLIEVDHQTLQQITPDFALALKAEPTISEVIITAKSPDQKHDFYSRCFGPWVGVDEDPVTGASQCILAPYWEEKLGKRTFSSYQSSKRGGFMELKITDDRELEIYSQSVVVLEGEIQL